MGEEAALRRCLYVTQRFAHSRGGSEPHLIYSSFVEPTQHPKRHLDGVCRFSTIHGHYDRTNTELDRNQQPIPERRLRMQL